ncbi:MAG TPA: hypothetical protein VGP24_07360 [Glaciihabitans sp.]|nr:hypothetical protein [Glaciihabitans sp.]
MSKRSALTLSLIAVVVVGVAACSTGTINDPALPGGTPSETSAPHTGSASDSDELMGQGMVMQQEGEEPSLCLGAVMESYPPQCLGSPIVGWDWEAAEQEESAAGSTWGTYAVQGTWDGTTFTLTQPAIPLSLYDPMYEPDPLLDEANAGQTPESELVRISDELVPADFPNLLSTGVMNGYLFVTVIHDDGSLQEKVDATYGEGVVVVQSALTPVG